MRQRTQDAAYIVLVSIGFATMGFGSVILGLIIAVIGSLILFLKREYILAAIAAFTVAASLCVAYVYPDLFQAFAQGAACLLSLVFLRDAYYGHRIKERIGKVLNDIDTETFRIDILSYKVNTYYNQLYSLEKPVIIRIQAKGEIIRGYFDLNQKKFVIEEPIQVPSYSGVSEKVWKEVVRTHENGTPRKIEYRNDYEMVVGADVYTEGGAKTSESWRLKGNSYEAWNPVKREWEEQPRGWKPRKSLREYLLG